MKKFMTVAAIGALVAVAGCSDKSENAGGTVKREAGNWKTDVKLVKFEVPGMAPEMKTQMTQMMERSEEHTSELQSLMRRSYADCLLTKKHTSQTQPTIHIHNDRKSTQN